MSFCRFPLGVNCIRLKVNDQVHWPYEASWAHWTFCEEVMMGLDMGKLSGVMFDKVTYTTIYIPSILMVHQCTVEEERELWWKNLTTNPTSGKVKNGEIKSFYPCLFKLYMKYKYYEMWGWLKHHILYVVSVDQIFYVLYNVYQKLACFGFVLFWPLLLKLSCNI